MVKEVIKVETLVTVCHRSCFLSVSLVSKNSVLFIVVKPPDNFSTINTILFKDYYHNFPVNSLPFQYLYFCFYFKITFLYFLVTRKQSYNVHFVNKTKKYI